MILRRVFIDTNILLYAEDTRADPAKRDQALHVLAPFFLGDEVPMISVQVLKEYAFRLSRWGFEKEETETHLEALYGWAVIDNTLPLFRDGLRLWKEHRLSFWDAQIVSAALAGGAEELWTEDFNAGQAIGPLRLVDPLRPS